MACRRAKSRILEWITWQDGIGEKTCLGVGSILSPLVCFCVLFFSFFGGSVFPLAKASPCRLLKQGGSQSTADSSSCILWLSCRMAENRIKKKSKWATFPRGAWNTVPAFRQTQQTQALIGGCFGTKGNWYLKKKSPESQLSRWFSPELQEGWGWGQGKDAGITQLPPGYRWLKSDKDGQWELTSHPRISQRVITPCGGYLGPEADHFQPAAVASHSLIGGFINSGAKPGRQATEGSNGEAYSEATVRNPGAHHSREGYLLIPLLR